MLDIVKADFPNSMKYRDAALKFRLPYWDPYRPRGGRISFPGAGGTTSFPYDFKLPEILTVEQVMVLTKETDTRLTRIRNPLFRFTYPSTGSLTTSEWRWVQDVYQGAVSLVHRQFCKADVGSSTTLDGPRDILIATRTAMPSH